VNFVGLFFLQLFCYLKSVLHLVLKAEKLSLYSDWALGCKTGESGPDSEQGQEFFWSSQREKGLGTTQSCLESVPEVISWHQLVKSLPTCGLKSDWSKTKFKAVLRRFFNGINMFHSVGQFLCLKRLIILVLIWWHPIRCIQRIGCQS